MVSAWVCLLLMAIAPLTDGRWLVGASISLLVLAALSLVVALISLSSMTL
jgi:hypothetical protein